MKSALLLLFGLCACQAKDYVTSKFSETYVKTSKTKLKLELEMDSNENSCTMTLVGPSDVWYSVGFGNSEMGDTYSIIVDGYGDVSERWLVGKTAGNELDFTWEINSNIVEDNQRTVILTRDYDYQLPTEYHQEFKTSSSKMETIWGYGTGADLDDHGKDKRGSSKIEAKRSTMSKAKEAKLYGALTEDYIREEYESYLTTSSVLTWVSCGVILTLIVYFCYKRWLENKNYEEIPDNASANINMVRMGNYANNYTLDDEIQEIQEVV